MKIRLSGTNGFGFHTLALVKTGILVS